MIRCRAQAAALAAALGSLAADGSVRLRPVPARELHVTQGELRWEGGAARIDGPRLRAVAPGRDGERAELRFTYLGPSRDEVPLGSGELRAQLGLKLRAADACNVIYAMWRLAPDPVLAVQVKRNPGATNSADCGNRGYTTVRPRTVVPLGRPAPGATHTLGAEIQGDRLEVRVDGRAVWEGELPPESAALRGPPGVRTDNVRAVLELRAAP